MAKSVARMRDWFQFKLKVPTWLLALLILGLLGTGGYLAYNQYTASQRQEARRRLQTATAERLNLPVTIAANGTVQPERSVNMSPKSSGVLKRLLVKEGDRVQEGQILANMDDSNFQGQLTQAQGQLAQAQANLAKLEAGNRSQDIGQAAAQLSAAQANLARLESGNRPQEIGQAQAQLASAQSSLQQAQLVFSQNQQLYTAGAISQRDLDASRTAFETARAQVTQAGQGLNLQQVGFRPEEIAQARAQVEQLQQALSLQQAGARSEDVDAARAQVLSAEGQVQSVQTQINDTIIRAPFRGVVTKKFADPGAFVTPTTSGSAVSSATSSSILSLASTNQIVAKVPETSISRIKVGQSVTIEADAYPGMSFKGRVTQVATQSTVDQNVTNFEVKASLEDPQNQLQGGMNTSVKFNVGTLENALVVPTVAIVRQEQGTGVLLAPRGEGRSRFQPITTGATVDDKTIVVSGLKEGDQMLLSYAQGDRPASRTPSLIPGVGGPPGGGAPGGGAPGGSGGSGRSGGGRRGGGGG
ncbi:MAG TPA: efflux RND transporter periplasmic adaptor subunit [Thermosynechococcaceae cyanobacterium]